MSEASARLDARGIGKSFPGVRALEGVDLEVHAGEVLAVVGENGAGKSTLMKILAGVENPDEGRMHLEGATYAPRTVEQALDAGVALIHQELNLAGNLDIAANICLGREPRRFGVMSRRRIEERARRWIDAVRLDESVRRRVEELSIGHRQLVEIAKALSIDAQILIMDEPTSSLSLHEAERLFEVTRDLRDRGVAIIYISHRLGEVERVADRVVVLRDGAVSGELAREDITRDRIVHLMIGRELDAYQRSATSSPGARVLEGKGLRTSRHPNAAVDLSVRAGEIVGLAGLVGAGRTELLESIFGVDRLLDGEVRVEGQLLARGNLRSAIERGVAFIPEDRKEHGVIAEWPVRANLSLVELRRHSRVGLLDFGRERASSRDMSRTLRIGASGDRQLAALLSGGNQQKVVLGKWLAMDPRLLLMDEPTRGVDVGARAEIYRIMEDMVAAGAAILFASSDLEEIIGMADRVLVMHDGRITGELERDDLGEEAIMRLATMEHEDGGQAA